MKKKVLTGIVFVLCMAFCFSILAGCGDSESSKSASAKFGNVATIATHYVGTWKLAAAGSEGITMAGNFSDLMGVEDKATLILYENGTGEMSFDEDPTKFTWVETGENKITLIPTEGSKEGSNTNKTIDAIYKDEALFMDMEEDGKTATMIFTHDGKYAEARIISLDNATPITSEDDLIGVWKMTGMNLMGISIYGSAEALSAMSGGQDMSITFEKSGKAVMSDNEGTWKVTDKGATFTSNDITGTHTSPVMKLGNDIVIDMSEAMGGNTFLTVLSK